MVIIYRHMLPLLTSVTHFHTPDALKIVNMSNDFIFDIKNTMPHTQKLQAYAGVGTELYFQFSSLC